MRCRSDFFIVAAEQATRSGAFEGLLSDA